MPVRYDTQSHGFVIESDTCPDCRRPLYDSGCDAPGCNGWSCLDCGTGCDLDFAPEGEGRCAAASEAESDEEYEARVNEERAAFGLSPISGYEIQGASEMNNVVLDAASRVAEVHQATRADVDQFVVNLDEPSTDLEEKETS